MVRDLKPYSNFSAAFYSQVFGCHDRHILYRIYFLIFPCAYFHAMPSILKSIQIISMFMWFLMLMRYDVPCWTDMSIWDGAVLAIPMCQICSHEKSWEMIMEIVLLTLHIIIFYIFTELYSESFILHTSVVQLLYRLLILWIQYTIWSTNLKCNIFLISNVYIRKSWTW